MRAWLEILREKHPGIAWIALPGGSTEDDEDILDIPVLEDQEALVLTK